MCVTNTSHRRAQAISLGASAATQVRGIPSLLSQRMLGGYSNDVATSTMPALPAKPHQMTVNSSQAAADYLATMPTIPTGACATMVMPQAEKPRPKRRRKPQKPGKTAKMNDRHFVVHNYHDHANDHDDHVESDSEEAQQRRRGGVAIAFPLKLHAVLDQVEADGLAHVISWQAHGRCFVIHRPKEFVDHVMPRYFRQTKLTSFQRQLNLYGFCRLTRGEDAGGYYHELFLRGKTFLCKKMMRTKVKGTKFKAASNPEAEPDFYTMPPILVTPHHSSDEEQSYGSQSGTSSYDQQLALATMRTQQLHSALDLNPLPISTPAEFVPPAPAMARAPHQYQHQHYLAPLALQSFSTVPQPPPIQQQVLGNDADRVLDEAVDELFLSEQNNADANLAEFVQDWDPSFNTFQASLEDDVNLGFMLEKLLEED